MNNSKSYPWTEEEFMRAIYLGFLEREPEEAGMEQWIKKIYAGESLIDILKAFVMTPEYLEKKRAVENRKRISFNVMSYAKNILKEIPITIVDVGAQLLDQEKHIYEPLLKSELKCKIIGFEPLESNPWQNNEFNKNHEIILYPFFIGDGNKQTFHINQPDSTSSLLPLNISTTNKLIHLDNLSTLRTKEVDTITLTEAISDVPQIDFLKLDIQGFEHKVLSNAKEILFRTSVVHCEVSFIQMYEKQPLFSEVDQLLRSAGFKFIDFNYLCKYSFQNNTPNETKDQLGWGDAVYFKEEDNLHKPEHLLIQSIIALLVYKKKSLAHFLAREYDALTGDSFSLQFKW